MPSRIVREGILTSEPVNTCSWPAEVLYRRLLSVVDDFGRYYAKEALIRGACYPLKLEKVSDSDIGKWLTECVNAALVRVYLASDGKRYLEILKFGVPRAKKSRFPDPCEQMQADENGCAQMNATVPYSNSYSNSYSGSKPLARTALAAAPPGVEQSIWEVWVRQKGKKQTAEADRLQRKHLSEWAAEGHDVNRIVERAVAAGHAGLIAPNGTASRSDQKARNIAAIGQTHGRTERDITGIAERVDRKAIPAPEVDLREPSADDVRRGGPGGPDGDLGD